METLNLEDNIKEKKKSTLFVDKEIHNNPKNKVIVNANINNNIQDNEIYENVNIIYSFKEIKYKWKIIPYKNEAILICENIHLQANHGVINSFERKLHNNEFYWLRYSTTMSNVIKNCSIFSSSSINVAKKPKLNHIIPEGPIFRYHADLWEFDKNLKKKISL